MRPPASVGVDNGGTWIRLTAIDSRGHRVWSLQKPSPSVDKLPSFLRKVLAPFRKDLCRLTVASRGVWTKSKRAAVQKALHGVAAEITVLSDVEGAWLAAFEKSGIVVISGTGSIAYGRSSSGRSARAGGLGPDKGDEGSGYWIGNEWLKRTKTRKSVREVAQYASKVIVKAKAADPQALRIIQEAQLHLVSLVEDLAKELHFKKIVPLATHGSVLGNPWFRRGFIHQLRKCGVSVKMVPSPSDVATSLAAQRSIMSHGPR